MVIVSFQSDVVRSPGKRKFVRESMTSKLVKITEKAIKTSLGIKPDTIRRKIHKLF